MACGVPKELINGISNKRKGLLGCEKAAFRNVCEAYPGEEKTKIDIVPPCPGIGGNGAS